MSVADGLETACMCAAGYAGARCGACADGHVGYDTGCKVVMAELTLATAIEDIGYYGTAEREKFESEFKADIAALMDGVTPAEVEILEIRSASVVVTFAINAATAMVAAAAVNSFEAAVESAPPTIAGVTIATFGVVGSDTESSGATCGVDARQAVLDCAPKRWDGFPFGTDGSDDIENCRRTALQSYVDGYYKCYDTNGCVSQWSVFCEKKVSEWAAQCNDDHILRLKCEGHQQLDLDINWMVGGIAASVVGGCLLYLICRRVGLYNKGMNEVEVKDRFKGVGEFP